MKKLRIYLALTLVVALIASIAAISSAEVQVEEDWQADIRTLMDESLLPKATTVQYDHALPEGTAQTPHAYAIEKIGSDGTTLRSKYVDERYGQFYDVREIIDLDARPDYGVGWQ